MLNVEQREVVEASEGAVAVIAGPGTGKTHTFIERIKYLIDKQKINPHNILCITFTRGAKNEISDRLAVLSSVDISTLWVDTFHGFALRILRQEQYPFGKDIPVKILEEEQQTALLKQILKSLNKKPSSKNTSDYLKKIRLLKREDNLDENINDPVINSYQQSLYKTKSLDFDDLLIYAYKLFQQQPQILKKYQQRFQYIGIDEFQDTGLLQYKLMKILSAKHNNICVIGDPDQSIYNFCSNNFSAFTQFQKDYPDSKIIHLKQNYRSHGNILKGAQCVIEKNTHPYHRDLFAKLKEGMPVSIKEFNSDIQEAEITVRKIESLLGGTSFTSLDTQWAEEDHADYGFSDIVILYRLHAQANAFKKVFDRVGLPYRILGKNPIYQIEQADFYQPDTEHITLMSLHQSKGLEFPVVFITGCEANILPAEIFDDPSNPKLIEEERRLFYVGITRAKQQLYVSYAKKRFLFGTTYIQQPSPFLTDLQKTIHLFEKDKYQKKISAKKQEEKKQMKFF